MLHYFSIKFHYLHFKFLSNLYFEGYFLFYSVLELLTCRQTGYT
jgi:hypothetical protein